jgi:tight adherence protein B
MDLPVSPLAIIGVSGALMLGGGAYMFAADKRARAHRTRLEGILSAYAPVTLPPSRTSLALAARQEQSEALKSALSFLQIDTSRPDLYPARWWLLLGFMLLPSVLIASVAFLLLGGILPWVALPFDWLLLTRMLFGYFHKRRTAILYTQFPDALAMIVRSVRAGIPVPEALRIVGEEGQFPTSAEFQRLYDEIRLGGSLPDALTRLAQRSSMLEYRFFAVSLALQSQAGGGLSETLENLADVIRKRVALKQRAVALASEAKLTMYVLAVLPFIAGLGLIVLSPDYVQLLVTTSSGKKLLAAGIFLLCLGIGSMRVLIRKAVS